MSNNLSLETSLVDISFINSSAKRSSFSESNLENFANLILQLNGIIKPLVLKRIGFEKFEVIDGHFEYYAAVKAQEINPNFEIIRAFIITDEQIKLVEQQNNLLTLKANFSNQNSELNLSRVDLEILFNNLESHLINKIDHLQQQLQQNQVQSQPKIKETEETGVNKINTLEIFNSLPIHQLILALKKAEITQKESEKIAESVKKEREKQPFSSLNDVVNRVKKPRGKSQIKAISLEKMLDIIDIWSKISFNF